MDKFNSIAIKNIYYMLTYAFRVLNQSNYEEISSESFDYVQDLFAAILSRGIAQQLKQGLHRDYVEKVEDMPGMRGKLNFSGTMRNVIQNRKLLCCEYDELSVNNVFNQVLKTTVLLLMKERSVRGETKRALKKEMLFFSEVDEIDPFSIRWDSMRFNRNNQSYRMLLQICQFVIEGLLLTTEEGTVKFARFLDDQNMCKLYEKFILEFYRKEMPRLKANASEIKWQLEGETSSLLPAMQSDIMLSCKEKTLIIDAKFYSRATQVQFDKRTLHSANVYQIFTYVMNHDVGNTGNVAGMLLYAGTDEEITPDMDAVIMGHRISAKTLDLNRDFSQISGQLKQIAYSYFGDVKA